MMLEVGMKVKFDAESWRVAGLNTLNGDVYLERGASGLDRHGPAWHRTVLAKNVEAYVVREDNGEIGV
jgi:hypothetical protein